MQRTAATPSSPFCSPAQELEDAEAYLYKTKLLLPVPYYNLFDSTLPQLHRG